MKYFNKVAYFSIIVLLILSACSPQQNKTKHSNIASLLDSLGLKYAPDKRISLWDVSISGTSEAIELIGEVDNKNAFSDINDIILKIYPDIKNSIDLLPKKNK